jgi:hypothetical protein
MDRSAGSEKVLLTNVYRGFDPRDELALHIVNLEGTWKITAIELMDEKRVL